MTGPANATSSAKERQQICFSSIQTNPYSEEA
jgi:hypothetical protein